MARDGWTARPLAECGEWLSGGTPHRATDSYWGGDFPWISGKSLVGFLLEDSPERVTSLGAENGTRLVPADTVLFLVRGMSLANEFKVGVTTRPVTFNQDVKAIRVAPDIFPLYLAYYLQAAEPRVLGMVSNASHGTCKLDTSRLEALSVRIPPLAEQKRIAAILSSIDDAIRATQAVIEQTRVVKQGLLQQLMTRGIGHTRFKRTEVGEIPASWDVVSVSDIAPPDRQCVLTGPFGAQLSSEDFVADGVPVLRIGNVQWGVLSLDDLVYVTEAKARQLSRFSVHAGDVLFARQGATTGRNALAPPAVDGWLINYHIIRVAVDRARCLPEYLAAYFNSPMLQQQVDQEKARGTREGVSTATIQGLRLPLPALDEQHQIGNLIAALSEALAMHEASLEQQRNARVAVLADLLMSPVATKNTKAVRMT